jgi:hypothetical protein
VLSFVLQFFTIFVVAGGCRRRHFVFSVFELVAGRSRRRHATAFAADAACR